MRFSYVTINGDTSQVFCEATATFVPLTDQGYLLWTDNNLPLQDFSGNDGLVFQIQRLELQQTDRRLREAIAGTDNGWLANLNSTIAHLRSQITK